MSKIPFKVSARTALLIGRENIASSKGAIIELVKNSYDADSAVCIVYFDNKYSILQDTILLDEYSLFKENNINLSLFNRVYAKNGDQYQIKNTSIDADKLTLKKELSKLNVLYIIDAGEGMTQQVIKNHWMTIGTDNKAVDIFTKNGRVKAGAKGIGRFALDKLGGRTEMATFFDNKIIDKDDNGQVTKNCGYRWKVNWSDFEGDFKTIDSVNAELISLDKASLKKELPKNDNIIELVAKYNFTYGTMLKITNLRENWENFYVNQIYSDLEVLVPPKEHKSFDIFLFSSLEKGKYGEIKGSICDDYDYKLIAKADKDQNITINVYRNEFDRANIP